jgi:hypothetical protein
MAQHFDEDAIRLSVRALDAANAPLMQDAGVEGIQARLLSALGEEFHVAVAREINRAARPEDLRIAVAGVLGNWLATAADTTWDDADAPGRDAASRRAAAMRETLVRCVAALITLEDAEINAASVPLFSGGEA